MPDEISFNDQAKKALRKSGRLVKAGRIDEAWQLMSSFGDHLLARIDSNLCSKIKSEQQALVKKMINELSNTKPGK